LKSLKGIKALANKFKKITGRLIDFHSKNKDKKLYPFKNFASVWTFFLGLIFLILLFHGPLLGKVKIYPGDFINSQNRLYLLSAAAQSLAAILALGISAALVSVQLVSQMFTPKVIKLKLRDLYFWFFIGLYIGTIIWVLGLMGWLRILKCKFQHDKWSMDIGLLLTWCSVLFLVPFIQSTIWNLQPVIFIKRFLTKKQLNAVEETLHSAVDEGFSTIIREAGKEIRTYTELEMTKENQASRLIIAQKTSQCFLNVGKRAFRKNEDECLFAIFEHLRFLTEYCTEKIWRDEAEIFNIALAELYDFTQEEYQE
jgi:hypothetical protein